MKILKPPIVPGTAPGKNAKCTHAEVSRLAYQLFERDGFQHGSHLEHWFNAESMVESNFGYGRDHIEHDYSLTTGEE